MLMRFLLITIPHVLPPSPWMDLDRLGMDVEKEEEEEGPPFLAEAEP